MTNYRLQDHLDGFDLHPLLRIGGSLVEAETADRIDVLDPATEQPIGTVPDAAVSDCIAAVDAADAAASSWAATGPRLRAEILRGAFERMIADAERLAHLISLENGKTLADARAEVLYAAEFFRWYSEEAVRAIGEFSTAPSGGTNILVQFMPVGVCLLVTPWNFPAAMATRKLGAALAAGCTCVLKPAVETPLTAYALADILSDAGLPPGVINVVTTSKSPLTVGAMMADTRVRKLSFTGSTQVGRSLAKAAAERIVKCSLELGGNAPFIVLENADLDLAIEGAMIAKMRNGGQACTAANRFLVHRSLTEAFGERLALRMGALRMGKGTDPDADVGPMVSQKARAGIAEAVALGLAEGGTLLSGGVAPDRPGYFYAPTVIANLPSSSKLLDQEIFGPVAPITAFEDEDEAIALANNSESGLASYVYARDLGRAMRVASKIEAGMVAVNRGIVSEPAAPFGGVKQSGIGREGGHRGMLDYMELKYMAVSW
ncbi:succinate-semialdehyde dehydrogenase [Devosia riboflavina]|uniref:Succinate-semialdehyde dehydrogenase n=1 Tax=Devosia riboflavina TaxID=46914 RepID=A0A087LZI2_9HYPH|nr:NAD-dependent succinate-semialdehyde dehydrogenase [Devosia riboflavina]KFL30035.1 succinate-semialdehyde dehydrogenase [Devosia riboflavina]